MQPNRSEPALQNLFSVLHVSFWYSLPAELNPRGLSMTLITDEEQETRKNEHCVGHWKTKWKENRGELRGFESPGVLLSRENYEAIRTWRLLDGFTAELYKTSQNFDPSNASFMFSVLCFSHVSLRSTGDEPKSSRLFLFLVRIKRRSTQQSTNCISSGYVGGSRKRKTESQRRQVTVFHPEVKIKFIMYFSFGQDHTIWNDLLCLSANTVRHIVMAVRTFQSFLPFLYDKQHIIVLEPCNHVNSLCGFGSFVAICVTAQVYHTAETEIDTKILELHKLKETILLEVRDFFKAENTVSTGWNKLKKRRASYLPP